MDAALDCRNLGKRYGKTDALLGLEFAVEEGERFALLGPNGAGKTTLVSIVATLLKPTTGTVEVFGHDVGTESRGVRRAIGYVPQDIALYPMLSAVENLRFFGTMQGLSGRALRERTREVIEFVGLEEHARNKVRTYSGGMKRRLNLAVGLIHRPRLLLLDEPTVGVDPQSRNHILENIRGLNEDHGITVLYTTHYMEEVETLCRRVAIIDHGQIVANDTVTNLTGNAGGSAIRVRTPMPHALLEGLRLAEGVTDASVTEVGEVAFTAISSPVGIATLAEVAGVRNIELQDIQVSRISLEQAFLRLTGRALRD